MLGFACEFQVSLEFYKLVLVLLYENERSSGLSELLINYKQHLLTFELQNPDLRGLACEFWVSSEFCKIVLVLFHEIERSSGLSELLLSYKHYLTTFKLYNPDVLGFACEFRIR